MMKYELKANNVEVTDYDWEYDDLNVNATGVFDVSNGDVTISVTYTVYVDYDHIDFDIEPDGEPTYVPYGSTDVMYDDGSSWVDGLHIKNAIDINWEELYEDLDLNNLLDSSEASKILGCTEEQLEDFLNNVVKSGYVFNEVVRQLEAKLTRDNRYLDKVWDNYKEM